MRMDGWVPLFAGVAVAAGCGDAASSECSGPAGEITLLGSRGHQAVFHDADGAVLETSGFDADGRATGTIPPCGAVTFRKGTSTYFTVTHAMPGDTIRLRYPSRAPGTGHPVEVDFPPHAGATSYSLRPAYRAGSVPTCAGSSAATGPLAATFDQRCMADDGTISFLVVAHGEDGAALAYATFERVELAATGTTSVSVSAWQTEFRPASVQLQNPADPTWEPSVRLLPLLGGMYAQGIRFGTDALPLDGDRALLVAALTHPRGHESGVDQLLRVVPTSTVADLVIDAAADFAPHVTSIARDDTDPARPRISWTTATPVPAEYTTAVIADWEQFQWFLVTPPDAAGELRFPDLPADARPTTPPQTGHGAQAVIVARLSTLDPTGVRQEPLSFWFPTLFSDPVDDLELSFAALGDYDQPDID